MAIKVFGVLCLLVCSSAAHFYDYTPVYHQQPIAYVQQPTVYHAAPVVPIPTLVAPQAAVPVLRQVEYNSAPAKYDFSYGVHDSLTGDIKSQRESRDGGNVQGSYSLIDSDGYKRTVTYTADDVNGFNAIVQREPLVGIASPIVAAQVPQSQYLPVAQAPAPVPVAPQQPVEQPIEEAEIAPPAEQQPQDIPLPENDNFQDIPQSDEDSEVIDAFGAATRSISPSPSSTESSLNQEEVAPRRK